ncbi:amino acid ABC transporter ATP-binding/permease protein [Paenibacillus sp. HN-1]|uniref:amino acid ABC transporter ATP-binding/permease protein n=1 Tax=Paenibacillus TaxID=44249 RepID=UPI001CA9D819|nr:MULTISPECIES: amino acid ABC transporter ATP-binding/permease protein [Paenibacillus]MBY9082112.1 amino acid ABC transporter ATP-binding/permease protein [Paenibacillus sp. CGMCC 1.18879]MBY9082692.1 amino acid ABC transporter ATP-binding/permease protein [Paenibacillus sinensis]
MRKESWLTAYVPAYFWRFLLIVLLGTLTIFTASSLMYTSGFLISKASIPPENILMVYVPIVGVRAFGTSRAVVHYVERLVSHDTILRILSKMRQRLYDILEPQALLLSSRFRTGDILGMLADDIEYLQNIYLRTVFPAVISLIVYAGAVIAIGTFDVRFALVTALYIFVLVAVLPALSLLLTQRRQREVKQERNRLYQKLTDAVLGMSDWMISGRQSQFVETYEQDERVVARTDAALRRWARTRTFIGQAVIGLGVLSMIWWAGGEFADGAIPGTLIAAFVLVVFPVADAFLPVSEAIEKIPQYRNSLERLQGVEEPQAEASGAAGLAAPAGRAAASVATPVAGANIGGKTAAGLSAGWSPALADGPTASAGAERPGGDTGFAAVEAASVAETAAPPLAGMNGGGKTGVGPAASAEAGKTGTASGASTAASSARTTAEAAEAASGGLNNCSAHISIRQAGYRYGQDGEWSVQALDLDIPQGKRIAIIGRSGAGKSTLLKLIQGALSPGAGHAEINGKPAVSYGDDIPKLISVLNQSPHLFDTTVGNNIRLGRPDASEADIAAAGALAKLDGLIASLPAGYDTPVREAGQRFSGGERQRIALARILLQNTPVVLLDEPTVGLDPRTERELLSTMFAAMQGKTLVWVTHHLVGAESMDEVIFMENGRIIMRGTHADLMAAEPRYRRLYELDRPGFADETLTINR